MPNYHLEEYWSEIADNIESGKKNILSGGYSPFSQYKRKVFIKLLENFPLEGKKVLEIGCGAGDNLVEILLKNPKELHATDISNGMIALARKKVGSKVDFAKINGTELPYSSQKFDVVFSSSVLQHNTDEIKMQTLLKEMCRVANESVILFERIDSHLEGDEMCMSRPVEYYTNICRKEGFDVVKVEYANIQASDFMDKTLKSVLHSNEELFETLEKITLPITRSLDGVFKVKKGFAKIEMVRR